ncbi:MAG: endonuclease [Pseudomonas sp.]
MFRSCRRTVLAIIACVFYLPVVLAAPSSFEAAKALARQQVYHDRTQQGTFYCGCQWQWAGRSGGVVNHASCGYQTRAQPNRAARIEWEHIVPASLFGQQRQCWQQGGRSNCKNSDPVFNVMEANLHNLAPSVGEINADRSNYRFGMLPATPYRHGQCDFKVEFKERVAEPRDAVKGQIARVWFYMHDHYDLRMSAQQQRLLMAWDKQFPVSGWEQERDKRISRLMGHGNPFVSGARQWTLNHRNSAAGLVSALPARAQPQMTKNRIKGNQRSKVYHLPQGCPGYSQVGDNNVHWFDSEAQARQQGYRKAGNCR